MSSKYNIISFNGDYIQRLDLNISLDNRGFRYGDGLFETMHANGLEVQFLLEHIKRIIKGAKILKIILPSNFTFEYLSEHINGLLNRCKLYQGARVRIYIVRQEGGLYIPKSNSADVTIEASYLSKGPYELNADGLVVGVFKDTPRVKLPFGEFKSLNALPFVLAGVYASENKFNDVLLVDNNGFIVEATSSNLFCVNNKEVYTPALNTGCVNGIMRAKVIEISNSLGFKVIEKDNITEDNLLEMDELFLTNAVSGIKWVAGLNNRRYYKRYSMKILQELNRVAFSSSLG